MISYTYEVPRRRALSFLPPTSFLPSKNSVRSPGERNRANFYLPVNQASEILPELLGSPTITGVSGENNFCLNAWRDRSVEEWKGLGRATKEVLEGAPRF